MIITVWRVEKEEYLDQVSTGLGAMEYGGRWNSIGSAVVYSSASIALGMLEIIAAGLRFKSTETRFAVPITFDTSVVFQPDLFDLPNTWWTNPMPGECQNYGTHWASSQKSAVLTVPSVVVDLEMNYILNPEFPEFKKVVSFGKPVAIRIDPRLRKK